jgi:hypothetical protein
MLNELLSLTDVNNTKLPIGLICTVSFYLSAALVVRAKSSNAAKLSLFKGAAQVAIHAWGGQIIVDFLLGNGLSLFADESRVAYSALAWLITSRSEITDVLGSLPAGIVLKTGSEVFRANLMLNAMAAGATVKGATLSPPLGDFYPGNFVAPFACGLLAGCGGGFIPLSNGLKAMDSWFSDWQSKSAAFFCLWMQTLTASAPIPKLAGLVNNLLGAAGITASNAASIGIFFLAVAPIVVSVVPDLPNPLGVAPAFKMPGGGKARGTPARSKSPKRR